MKKRGKKKEPAFTPKTDFKEQTPEMQIGQEKLSPLYEKAFLSQDEEPPVEFSKNTTTWD